MPRTASTFFQREVFPNLENFDAVGVEITQYHASFQRVLYQDESLFDESAVIDSLPFDLDKNLIISNELFVGQSLYLSSSNRTRSAKRLKALFPQGEIILFLRNQADLLESLYSIGVYSGHTSKPEEFVQFDSESSSVDMPLYPTFSAKEQTEQYKFSSLVKLYQSLFSKIHVFLYEDFRMDPSSFLSAFCEKLNLELTEGIDFKKTANSSLSARQLNYIRKTNRFKVLLEGSGAGRRIFQKNVHTIEHHLGNKEKFHFSPMLRNRLKKHFHQDNEALKSLLPGLSNSESFQQHYLSQF
jgi:hypothetical protein